jgi:transposase
MSNRLAPRLSGNDLKRARFHWRVGKKDTAQIAAILGCSEASVYNSLNEIRETSATP